MLFPIKPPLWNLLPQEKGSILDHLPLLALQSKLEPSLTLTQVLVIPLERRHYRRPRRVDDYGQECETLG